MLYLVTGANGTGKTLLTLKHVKELADREGRPVCHNGRFDPVPNGPLRNWRKIDIRDWQAEPDGTIFFVDECHNDFPKRGNTEAVPEYVRMLAEHRRRGFDFFLITQHPMNLDAFVRRLIGNPGWHRHLKRQAGMALVSQSQWDAVNTQCERPGSGESGQVTMVSYPREVYAWYTSAQLHTAKMKIPRAVYVLVACALAVPLLAWFGYRSLHSSVVPGEHAIKGSVSESMSSPVKGSSSGRTAAAADEKAPMSAAEYVAARMPRVPGLPFTAAAYDKVTEPAVAPYPAACVFHHASGKCDCYTQQATRLETPQAICEQIARSGIFIDWHQQEAGSSVREVAPVARGAAMVLPGGPVPVSVPGQAASAAAAASGSVLLSAPGDTTPKFFPAVTSSSGLVGEPTPQELRDAAVMLSMRDGQWSKR